MPLRCAQGDSLSRTRSPPKKSQRTLGRRILSGYSSQCDKRRRQTSNPGTAPASPRYRSFAGFSPPAASRPCYRRTCGEESPTSAHPALRNPLTHLRLEWAAADPSPAFLCFSHEHPFASGHLSSAALGATDCSLNRQRMPPSRLPTVCRVCRHWHGTWT